MDPIKVSNYFYLPFTLCVYFSSLPVSGCVIVHITIKTEKGPFKARCYYLTLKKKKKIKISLSNKFPSLYRLNELSCFSTNILQQQYIEPTSHTNIKITMTSWAALRSCQYQLTVSRLFWFEERCTPVRQAADRRLVSLSLLQQQECAASPANER